MKLAILLLAIACFSSAFAKTRYDNNKVYTIDVQTEQQFRAFQLLETNPDGYLFWSDLSRVGKDVDLMVAPHRAAEFAQLVKAFDIKTNLKINNVQELIDNEQPAIQPRVFGWESYQTLEAIYEWINEQVAAHPNLTLFNVGRTFEGRSILGVKLSHGTGKKAVIIESNIHAREWITSATTTWLLNEFLTSQDQDIIALANAYDWYIIPVANPDGFAFTQTTRLWRKTRSTVAGSTCLGADPNRNFDYNWMFSGASANPCSETFAGANPFSEIESESIANFTKSVAASQETIAYLSFHSYGQWFLIPFGHDGSHGDNYADVMEIGKAAISALSRRYNTTYVAGSTYDVLYAASGLSLDYSYAVAGIPITVCYEFRDLGSSGFILPANQIIPNALEVLDSLFAFFETASELGY